MWESQGLFADSQQKNRGDSNEYPQHMFLWRNKQNYPLIITKYLLTCSTVSGGFSWSSSIFTPSTWFACLSMSEIVLKGRLTPLKDICIFITCCSSMVSSWSASENFQLIRTEKNLGTLSKSCALKEPWKLRAVHICLKMVITYYCKGKWTCKHSHWVSWPGFKPTTLGFESLWHNLQIKRSGPIY